MVQPSSKQKKSNSYLRWNVLFLLLSGVVYGFIQLQFWWTQLAPRWQGLELSWGQIRIEHLSLHMPLAGTQQLQLQQLELQWMGWPWPLDSLRAKSLTAQLDLQQASTPKSLSDVEQTMPALPLWLPPVIAIEQIEVALPCTALSSKLSNECLLTGAITYSEQSRQIDVQLATSQAVLIEGLGDVQLVLSAKVQPAAEQILLPRLELQLYSDRLSWQQQQFTAVDLQLTAQVSVEKHHVRVEAIEPLMLALTYQGPDLKIQRAALQAKDLRLQLDPTGPDELDVSSGLTLKLTQLQHPQLHLLDWDWNGTVVYQQQQLRAEGQIANSQSLRLKNKLLLAADQLTLDWHIPELYFLAGNPLLFSTHWPELLTLQKGKVSAKGQLEFNLNTMQLNAQRSQLFLRELSGIYDRTVFSGLSSDLQLFSEGTDWTVQTDHLQVSEINHGVVLGPIDVKAVYRSKAPQWDRGLLDIQQLQLAMFGGQVTAAHQQLDLGKDSKLILQLDKLQLAELLKQHPNAEMTGQGTISGTLPLGIEQGKLSVTQGRIAALEPGGTISYQSDRALAMAESNQGMKVVVEALQNFHFSVLSATLTYSHEGQLQLALRLEGKNPDYEKGRAVHFTIQLEENLPALITSLQLSGQVSDIVKQRVQQRLATQKAKEARKEL